MCGISGIYNHGFDINTDVIHGWLNDMNNAQIHRGPDGQDIWSNTDEGIYLGHRRLSVIDTSCNGAQPMRSYSGRYTITYNGEIYNHTSLRALLQDNGTNFKGNSDTEVMLQSFDMWGIEESIKRFDGMFAFGVYDHKLKNLFIVRDRLGEKPLYFAKTNNLFAFASEITSLNVIPYFPKTIDMASLSSFLKYGNVPSPFSIFKNIEKLPPASIMKINTNKGQATQSLTHYWINLPLKKEQGTGITKNTYLEETESKLKSFVKDQLVSDVPLGIFLSGGIDSSLITALAQLESNQSMKSFTVGFETDSYDESKHAQAISQHLNTDHNTIVFSEQDAIREVKIAPLVFDEPFADASSLPLLMLAKYASSQITVALTGDGGDEIFGGYRRHIWSRFLSTALTYAPRKLRKSTASAISILESQFTEPQLLNLMKALPSKYRSSFPLEHLRKFIRAIEAKDIAEVYTNILSYSMNPNELLLNKQKLFHPCFNDISESFRHPKAMMEMDKIFYLPNDVLVKSDRVTMSTGLESRAPFLNHNLIEYSSSIPSNLLIGKNTNKWILREILNKYVPKHLTDRPKSGFSVPLRQWLMGPLNSWAREILLGPEIRRESIFDAKFIEKKWRSFTNGTHSDYMDLWCVLVFQTWKNR